MPNSKKPAARRKPAAKSASAKTDRTNRTAIKKARFLKAYALKECNTSAACEAAGIGSRGTIGAWKSEDPAFAEAVFDLEEADLDFSESALKKQIKQGNIAAIIFHLKCKGKKRGYVEKTEIDGSIRHTDQMSISDLQKSLDEYDAEAAK
jgi:hypothetical protein